MRTMQAMWTMWKRHHGGAGKRLARISLLLGLVAGLALWSGARTAHAAPTTMITVNTCDEATLDSAIATAASGDTITFGCSGDIKLTHTLTITKNLTLNGSGQHVTLDGGDSMQVLYVNNVNVTLNALTIAHGSNTGGLLGGGLENVGGTVTILSTTFTNNSAIYGGGIRNDGGTVSINHSTFADNSVQGDGAAIFNGVFSTLTISDSTITGNSSALTGGGINTLGTTTIDNSTIANNSAATHGGGLDIETGTVSIAGSIVANNTGGDCAFEEGGTLLDRGYSLESGTACGFNASTDHQNTDPKLASSLADNGGPTQTLALLGTSPAINANPGSSCSGTDQRGVVRPQGVACDIGAFEYRLPTLSLPGTFTADATGPSGATVSYTATTSNPDNGSAAITPTCAPASGSTFPIGTTTVSCTASNAAGTSSGSFSVTVVGASGQLSSLQRQVDGFPLANGTPSSYDTQLQAVQADLAANNTGQACSDLLGFINHVKAQSGKQLTTDQANALLKAAARIQSVIGC